MTHVLHFGDIHENWSKVESIANLARRLSKDDELVVAGTGDYSSFCGHMTGWKRGYRSCDDCREKNLQNLVRLCDNLSEFETALVLGDEDKLPKRFYTTRSIARHIYRPSHPNVHFLDSFHEGYSEAFAVSGYIFLYVNSKLQPTLTNLYRNSSSEDELRKSWFVFLGHLPPFGVFDEIDTNRPEFKITRHNYKKNRGRPECNMVISKNLKRTRAYLCGHVHAEPSQHGLFLDKVLISRITPNIAHHINLENLEVTLYNI